jgi:HSP20 family protein
MSTVNQLRDGLSKAWGSLSEGWRELKDFAGDSLTKFQPSALKGGSDTGDDKTVAKSSRWGILAAEVIDDGDSVKVTVEAPGLNASEIDVHIQDNVLVIRGEKKLARDEKRGEYHIMERAYGQFERAIRLPAVVSDDGAKAKYKSGVLTLSLPKAKAANTNRIAVE